LVSNLSCSTLVSSLIGGEVASGRLLGPCSPGGKTFELWLGINCHRAITE
jgi:hypothetical protein